MGGISPPTKQEEKIKMLATILKTLFKCVVNISAILGLAFMVICTIFVVICIIHGDIRINIVRDETENKKK